MQFSECYCINNFTVDFFKYVLTVFCHLYCSIGQLNDSHIEKSDTAITHNNNDLKGILARIYLSFLYHYNYYYLPREE